MLVSQAQDPIALISKLVKALNLYSNLGVGNDSNVNTNSNAWGASKKFWMQKTQTNWVFLTWSLCFIALSFLTIVLWFLCFSFLSLGFAFHYIHAFHSKFFFLFNIKKKGERNERKRKHIIVLALFSLFFENKVGQFIFTSHVLLYFV